MIDKPHGTPQPMSLAVLGSLAFMGSVAVTAVLIATAYGLSNNAPPKGASVAASAPSPALAAAPASPPAASASSTPAAAPTDAPAASQRAPAATAASAVPAPATPLVAAPSAATAAATPARFSPPDARKIPDTEMGAVIHTGEQIFLHTSLNAKAFTGNALNCVNCHLDAGRLAGSAPMWGAYPLYPAYRSKTKQVDTFAERLRGCFAYSMNGKAPPNGHEVLVALEAYAYWMATDAPTGAKLPGSGYKKLAKPATAPDFVRGQAVFEAKCALCHGADGQGQRSGKTQVFPPLWGPQSFNWGAGMHSIDNASAFIKANMPLGQGGSLSDQEAWDVATFMNSQERPQDPRFAGNVAETRKKFHDSAFSMYGKTVNGKVLGSGR